MVVQKEFVFPSDEELTCPELNIGWAYLRAASVFIAKKCEQYHNEFVLCRVETQDPRPCLQAGKDVTRCAIEGFQDIKKHCRKPFEAHVDCIVDTSHTLSDDRYCSETKKLFDECMLKNLNMERPRYGYFCEARVHDTARPKPPPLKPEFPDANPIPIAPPYKPAKHGAPTFGM